MYGKLPTAVDHRRGRGHASSIGDEIGIQIGSSAGHGFGADGAATRRAKA